MASSDQMDVPTVVFQGEPGAYSEQAALELLGDHINPVGLQSFDDCYEAVDSGKALFAMLPFENSLGGSIHLNYDLQLRHNLHIVAELDFRVRHCLMALPGVSKDDIKYAMSHPQALAQCDRYLHSLRITPKSEYDTAGSAKLIASKQLKDQAAIASSLAAKHYGLEILQEGIEDNLNNYTRFLLLSRTPLGNPEKPVAMKTGVVFTIINGPGVLFKALAAFTLREVDLTKIESRPDKLGLVGRDLPFLHDRSPMELDRSNTPEPSSPKPGDRFRYMFYLDLADSINSHRVRNALLNLKEICPFIRVLGSYPKGGILLGHVADAVKVDSGDVARKPAVSKTGASLMQLDASAPAAPSITVPKLRIGIVGFGNFGQFIAKTFGRWHTVKASSRTDYSSVAKELDVAFFSSADDMVASGLDVLVVATSILSFEAVMRKLPLSALANVLVVDVLSVKVLPKKAMLELLPPGADILCTHPMFGPESGKHSWRNLPCVFEKVRVKHEQIQRCESFLDIFRKAGCRMVDMSCELHDQAAAGSQFVTHFTGRMLSRLNLATTPINTKGFETLLALVDNTCRDSFDLFHALYRCNPNSSAQLEAMKLAVSTIEKELRADAGPSGAGQGIRLAARVNRVQPSKTGATHSLALELQRQGKDVITTLAVGEPDFPPPAPVLEAMVAATQRREHTRYTTVAGTFQLREKIAETMARRKGVEYDPASEVLVTAGGKQAIYQIVMALCEAGDEVVVPAPYWVSYPEIVRLSGAQPIIVDRGPDEGFILSPQALSAAITPHTRLLILCNPCNPTGATYAPAELEALAAVLRRPEFRHVLVLTDEIYERLVYDGLQHVSFASLEGMKERTMVVNGFAKAYAMTGARLGYMCGPREVVKACLTIQSQLSSCPNSLAQHAGVVALGIPDEDLQPLYDGMKEKRDFVVGRLNLIPGIHCPTPKGAFYVFPDISKYFGTRTPKGSMISNAGDLCQYLLQDFGLAVTDGAAFGAGYGIRFSYATSLEDLEKAMTRFEACLSSLVTN